MNEDISKTAKIQYSVAKPEHWEAIARLHAYSWQTHYRGIFTDRYLDDDVVDDRLQVWQRRFDNPSKEQYVIMALDGELLCGFGCVFLNYHEEFGALLDNLHVHHDWQGQGIGYALMKQCCAWTLQQKPDAKLYLWVLKDNHIAREFYEKVGGAPADVITENNPGGGEAEIIRIIWNNKDLQNLVGLIEN